VGGIGRRGVCFGWSDGVRQALHWVVSAKRSETRERRLTALVEASAAGRKIGPLRR
jgi:Bacteriocin-protection, YdeI or OmpD-Associated